MRVVIIGGSGHVGTYLVPRLIEAGHEVINISRAQREPYQTHGAWRSMFSALAAERPVVLTAGAGPKRFWCYGVMHDIQSQPRVTVTNEAGAKVAEAPEERTPQKLDPEREAELLRQWHRREKR